MEMDIEPRNKDLKTMEDVELDDAVEVTMGKERLKGMFEEKLKKAKGKEVKEDSKEEEEDPKTAKLSDFIEVIIKIGK